MFTEIFSEAYKPKPKNGLGSILICFAYAVSDEKSTVRGLLVCLSICDFFIACGNVVGLGLSHLGEDSGESIFSGLL